MGGRATPFLAYEVFGGDYRGFPIGIERNALFTSTSFVNRGIILDLMKVLLCTDLVNIGIIMNFVTC